MCCRFDSIFDKIKNNKKKLAFSVITIPVIYYLFYILLQPINDIDIIYKYIIIFVISIMLSTLIFISLIFCDLCCCSQNENTQNINETRNSPAPQLIWSASKKTLREDSSINLGKKTFSNRVKINNFFQDENNITIKRTRSYP